MKNKLSPAMERAMNLKTDEVRAILDGSLTEIRRPIDWTRIAKESGSTKGNLAFSPMLKGWAVFGGNSGVDIAKVTCPYGEAGDRLRVRGCPSRILLEITLIRVEGSEWIIEFVMEKTDE